MADHKIKLTDEEIEQILSAEVKRKQESAPKPKEEPKKKKHIYVSVDDDPEEYNGYAYEIISWFFDLIFYRSPITYYMQGYCKLLDFLCDKYCGWLVRHPINPYIAEFLYTLWYYQAVYLASLPLFLLLIGLPFGFMSAFLLYCTLAAVLVAGVLVFRYDVYIHLFNLALGKPKVSRSVELASLTVNVTNPNCKTDQPLSYISDLYPVVGYCFYFWYNPLPEDANPKSSRKKAPLNVFGDNFVEHQKGKKYFRIILSEEKADLFDQLFQLEPTAEFEITYLKYSNFFQSIRPIEGWEYAEGVPELCEKISKLYP